MVWRFWHLGNRLPTAGASRKPVRKLGEKRFQRCNVEDNVTTLKWRQVFNYLERKLIATDTARKWQHDDATFSYTQSFEWNHTVTDKWNVQCQCWWYSVSTVYNHLVRIRKGDIAA